MVLLLEVGVIESVIRCKLITSVSDGPNHQGPIPGGEEYVMVSEEHLLFSGNVANVCWVEFWFNYLNSI